MSLNYLSTGCCDHRIEAGVGWGVSGVGFVMIGLTPYQACGFMLGRDLPMIQTVNDINTAVLHAPLEMPCVDRN